ASAPRRQRPGGRDRGHDHHGDRRRTRRGSSMSRRVLILTHPSRPAATHTAELVAEELRRHAMTPIHQDEIDHGEVELAIVLGGDGTILHAAEMVRGRGTPLVGINLGHVGFLAESEVDRVAHVIARAAERDYEVEERMTLDRKSTRLNSSHVSISYAV